MRMTLDELQKWPPHIKALADAASKRGDASQGASGKVQAIVDISTWQGDAADAAKDAMKRSAARFDNAGFEATYVAMHANKAYGDSQALADDIGKFLADAAAPPKVEIDPKTNAVTPPDIKGKTPDDIQKIINKLKDLHSRVTGLIARGEMLDDDLARVLDQGTGGHTLAQKQLSEETPQQAQQDVHDVLAGTATDEEKARVQAASTLSPEQIEDRDAGRPVQLTRSQQLVLGQMNDQMKGMSIEDIHRAERRLGDNKSIVGNALQMMGSNQYAFARSERPGEQGSTDKLATGGFNELPTSVQNLLNDKNAELYHYAPLEHGMGHTLLRDDTTLGNLDRLSDVIKDGDAGFQHGTELDKKLMQRGADILHFENQNQDSYHGPADSTIQNIFSSAGRDHIVDHDMMVGTDGNGGNYNKQFLQDVTHHVYPDGGTAAGNLMSWTHDSAHEGPGVSIEQAKLSGETAHAYASYLADDKDLAKLPTTDHEGASHGGLKTLGQVSPGLVQGMAEGLMPYSASIGGGSHDILGHTPGFDQALDSNDDVRNGHLLKAKALVGILNTDHTAGEMINGALYADSIRETHHYADTVKADGHGDAGDLNAAGRFRGLADASLASANDMNHNAETATAKSVYEQKAAAYGYAQKILSGLGGAATGEIGGLGGPALDIAGEALKTSIIGSPPEGQLADTRSPNMAPGDGQAHLINAFLSQGVLQPNQIPDDMRVNARYDDPAHPLDHDVWRVKTSQELEAAMGDRYDPDSYSTEIGKIMVQLPGQDVSGTKVETSYNNTVEK
ncbi:hypothetical protein AWB85_20180 [Mycobacteroides immunogenum]|uniref:TPR repeat domain-containing protein n=1 Tax=Mycobacteroides immunogenum TaxID=83262 RepID=A0A179VHF3_9MYCO|nr:hypothetical protein [Mycobacteroides immunogenum]OAT69706.1 hypothetical protein AWB85_20180 [Mycobacteroides immunogenum]